MEASLSLVPVSGPSVNYVSPGYSTAVAIQGTDTIDHHHHARRNHGRVNMALGLDSKDSKGTLTHWGDSGECLSMG